MAVKTGLQISLEYGLNPRFWDPSGFLVKKSFGIDSQDPVKDHPGPHRAIGYHSDEDIKLRSN